jgi:hypothetical protein
MLVGSSIDIAVLSNDGFGVGVGVGVTGVADELALGELTGVDCGVQPERKKTKETARAQRARLRCRGWVMVTILVVGQLAMMLAQGVTLHSTQTF